MGARDVLSALPAQTKALREARYLDSAEVVAETSAVERGNAVRWARAASYSCVELARLLERCGVADVAESEGS